MTGKHGNAEIQAFYRGVNEKIATIARRLDASAALEILCECGSALCTERVVIGVDAYETVRREPTHFALLAGHEDQTVEDVVRRADGYLVVANYGRAATVARRTNPRSSSR